MKLNRVYFHTFGCKVNQYETQLLREKICSCGSYQPVEDLSDAEIAIVNTCTVTHNADADARGIIRKIFKTVSSARVIVTGCYAIRSPEELLNLSNFVEVCPVKENVPLCLGLNGKTSHQTITSFANHTRAFVKIQDGCDAYCSYCIVPYVRPELSSKPQEIVLKEVNSLVENGYKEIVLCGIRLGKYKTQDGLNLAGLVKKLLNFRTDFSLAFSSLEIQEITDDLVDIISNSKRIIRNLHIPLQSADNEILKLMKRPYTIEEFEDKINLLYKKLKGISLGIDVIVGFPGETERHFNKTFNFIRKNKFRKLHVFRYSPRAGTPAEKLPGQVSPAQKSNRARLLLGLNKG